MKKLAALLACIACAGCSSSHASAPPPSTASTSTSSSVSQPTRTTTPPTGSPTPHPSPAVSASWVSPDHGWVLRQNGAVDETTDAGSTWHWVGSFVGPADVWTMRFADATHGFAVDATSGPPASTLLATTDGGATWHKLATPFASVFAFDVANGSVYVVARDDSADVSWRIWSSAADRIAWTEDPMVFEPGAGPAIQFQFVFSGARGWLVEDDRGTVAAAALSAPGAHWTTWNAPCPGDYLELAAASANDLVATCEHGVWTGPRVTSSVNFSHDGGSTFIPHDAPDYGMPAAPDPSTTVIASGSRLERTTDDGGSWNVVAKFAGTSQTVREIGFTTSTQGYAIFSTHMLMTRDAGASWRTVRLP